MKLLQNYNRLITLAVVIVMGLAVLSPMANAQVSPTDDAKKAVCEGATGQADCGGANGGANKVQATIKNVIGIFSWIIGVTAVIVIMIAGFRFITAGGDSNSIASARNMILYAAIGLVIVGMAQIIVKFIIFRTPT